VTKNEAILLLFDDISLTTHIGIGTLQAQVLHTSEEFLVIDEGDDIPTMIEVTRSLRFHQFIDQ